MTANSSINAMKPGFLYVLVHPSDPNLYKIGVTTNTPDKRLAQHNSQFDKYAGKVVKQSGQKWVLQEYIAVPDPYWAEKAFWNATPFTSFPGGVAVEVVRMERTLMEAGLRAARVAGERPSPPLEGMGVRNREWLQTQLEGTGITLIGAYRGLVAGSDFRCAQGHEFTESSGLVAYRKACPLCGPDYRARWRRQKSARP